MIYNFIYNQHEKNKEKPPKNVLFLKTCRCLRYKLIEKLKKEKSNYKLLSSFTHYHFIFAETQLATYLYTF